MSRALRWSDLKIGLVAFVGIVAAVLAVLIFARIGALRGDTTTIHLVTNKASRVLKGTEVWLGGQKVGVVDEITFRAAAVDTAERILITMEVLTEHLAHIRKDSDVQLRPGGSLIGDPVVYITVGTGHAARLAAHDTLRARGQEFGRRGRRMRASDIAAIGDSVVSVAKTAKEIAGQIQTVGGEIQEIRARSEQQVSAVTRAFNAFSARAARPGGPMSLVRRDAALRRSVAHIQAQADSIRTLVASGQGTLGRFQRDTSLATAAGALLAHADTLRILVTNPTRALTREDSVLVRELDRTHGQLDSLIQDVKRHPFKYLKSL